jgi:erythrin-vacuolar iron transport family protein
MSLCFLQKRAGFHVNSKKPGFMRLMRKEIAELSEREILALAISLEAEDVRIYNDLAEKVRDRFPNIARILNSIRADEALHHDRLHALYLMRFDSHIPYLRRQDVKGFIRRKPLWLQPVISPRQILSYVFVTEAETRRYYQDAANHASSEEVRALLAELAEAEEDHVDLLVTEVKASKNPPNASHG